MGLLASLLPGVRDLRAPISAGFLWLAVLAIALAPQSDHLLRETPESAAMKELFESWPASLQVPVALAAAYLMGAIASTITQLTTRKIGTWLRALLLRLHTVRLTSGKTSPFLFRTVELTNPISFTARALSINSIRAILGRIGMPHAASIFYPLDHLLNSMKFSAPHLAINAPELYQEYDRLRSEAELRIAITPPVLCLAIIAPLNGKLWIVPLVTAACVVLEVQALSQTRSANNILANAAYLDQLSIPSLQAVVEQAKGLSDKVTSEGEWIAILIISVHESGMYDEAYEVSTEALRIGDLAIVETVTRSLKDYPEILETLLTASQALVNSFPQQHWKDSHELVKRIASKDSLSQS